MNFPVPEPLGIMLHIVLVVLGMAIFLTFGRLVYGPTVADRVVALDLMTTQVVGLIATYEIATREPVYLEVAMVLALIAFLGTVAFAFYLQRRGAQWGPQ